jgi:mycofactocin precursor
MEKDLTIDIKEEDVVNQDVPENPEIIEEIVVEELSIDGICGVY